jgi:hypothetical protein
MALIINLSETPFGIHIPNAYARLSMLRADKEGLLLQVSHYASEEAARSGAQSIMERTLSAPTAELQPGVNPLAIGYAWLKQQPAYADSKDT